MKLLLVLLFLVSCGKQDANNRCMTRAQVWTICVAEGIQQHPNPWQLPFVQTDCNRLFPVEDCYYERDHYYFKQDNY